MPSMDQVHDMPAFRVLAFNPVVRPQSVALCLEASKGAAAYFSREIP
jgi:hypothetical protein